MQVREIDLKADYETISGWWDKWSWPIVPQAILPDEGIMVESDSGEPVATGFLYLTNSKVAIAEWIVASPEIERSERAKALDLLIDNLCLLAEVHSKTHVFSFFEGKSLSGLIKRFKEHGFAEADTGMTHLVRVM